MKKTIIYLLLAATGGGLHAQCSFKLGSDRFFCKGEVINTLISGPPGYLTYKWSTGATTQDITINAEGTYFCTGTKLNTDLINNGNFDAGNTGFSSSYDIGAGGPYGILSVEGTYYVSNSPSAVHNMFPSFIDHTTGTGNMLVVNGSGKNNASVWCQSITVQPNKTYNFSAWVATCVAASQAELARLQFSINGVLLGSVFSPSLMQGEWLPFNATWTSGINTTAAICIVNQNTTTSGNDFALDDIYFQEVCTYTDTIQVKSVSIPEVKVTTPVFISCISPTVTLNATSTTPGVSYSWTGPSSFTSSLQYPVVSLPGVYTVEVKEPLNGCESGATVNVNSDFSLPGVDAGSNQTLTCASPTALLIGTSGITGVLYTWSGPNGFTANTAKTQVSQPGKYYLTVTNPLNGCFGKDSVTITSSMDYPVVGILTTDVSCFGKNDGIASVTVSGGVPPYSYAWTSGGMTSSISSLPPGNYTCTVTGANGCSTPAVANLSEPTAILVSPPLDYTICIGQEVTLMPAASGGTPPYSYTFYDPNSVTITNPIRPTISGTYSVVASDQKGCSSSSAKFLITISSEMLLAITAPSYVCKGTCVTLAATVSGGKGDYKYSWQPLNQAGASVEVCPETTTTYTVTVKDACGEKQQPVTLTVVPVAVPVIQAKDTTGCSPLCFSMSATGPPHIKSYNWTIDSKFSGKDAVLKDCVSAGDHRIELVVTDSLGCKGGSFQYVHAYAPPKAAFIFEGQDANQELSVLNNTVHFTNKSQGYISAVWDFGTGQTSTLANPSFVFPAEENCYTVSLIVSSTQSCRDTTIRELCIQDLFTIYFPNAFSPDEDLVNDEFKPKSNGIDAKNYHFLIFDRWGKLVFETADVNEGWKGTSVNKNEAPSGVYVWKCNVKDKRGKSHQYIGHVTLVR